MTAQDTVFTEWPDHASEAWGKEPIVLKHRIHENPLFSEDTLADLIDVYPSEHYDIIFMGEQGARHLWRNGEKGDLSGKQIIDAIRDGRFWINLRKVSNIDKRYYDLVQEMFANVEDRVPSLGHTFKQTMGILISSPKAQVYYHCDVPGQSIWQIAGTKRVFIYPSIEKFMPQKSIETIIVGEEEELAYNASLDDGAFIVDLEPGDMATWPLNGPHRVMNHDCMNISATTEHWTNDIRKSYGVHYANGILRRKLGIQNLKHDIRGPMVYPKLAFAAAYKSFGLHSQFKHKKMVDFKFDHSTPEGFVDIDAYAKA